MGAFCITVAVFPCENEIDAVETHEPLLKAHKFGETQEDFVESQ